MNIAENSWLSVDESMPTMELKNPSNGGTDYLESEYVLVWDGHKVDIAQAILDSAGRYWVDRCADVVEVVFWMPLPTPPTP